MVRLLLAVLVSSLLSACDSGSGVAPDTGRPDGSPGDLAPRDAGPELSVDAPPLLDTGPAPDSTSCADGTVECADRTHQRVCQGGAWLSTACAQGELCLDGTCADTCVDQCTLGETRTVGGVTETCQLLSVAQDKTVPLGSGLHDRARQFNAWIRAHHLPGGTLSSVEYTDTTYTTPSAYSGTGDSAIWTGTYLAGEALRLFVTGSPDAEQNVEQLVEAVHRLFQVTGHPGYHARFTAPLSSGDPVVDAIYQPNNPFHHVVTYNGQPYFWNGNTSRDQYQGVVLGYAFAYQTLKSAKHKQMIQQDMVALCNELIKQRKVTITFRFYALGQWLELPVEVDLQYVVLNPTEYKDGKPFIQLGTSAAPSEYGESEMLGFREFWPDYADVLKQLPVLGGLIGGVPIPRSGSAMMLASTLQVCQLVTDGDPAYAAEHAAFKAHYSQNINAWKGIMDLYVFLNAAQCWQSYYGLNIVFQPMYNLVRLEQDPALKVALQKVLALHLWPIVKDHKNVFFSYIHASQAPMDPGVQAIINEANAQLALIPPGRFADLPFDVTGQYPASTDCPGQSTVAVDADTRPGSHFIWQRHPFTLKSAGQPKRVYPRIDFTTPYWMARHHGFLDDDAKGTCLRWRK